MSGLPPGWAEATIGDIAETKLGKMLSAKSKVGVNPRPYLRNKNVQWGRIDVDDLLRMDFSDEEFERFRVLPGDLLVCEGGEVGRAAIWRDSTQEIAFQKAIHRVRPLSEVPPEFLLYVLMWFSESNAFDRFVTGSTIKHLPQEDLRRLPLPVPPLAEQRRIVAAIEEQFSRLDAAQASLARVDQRLGGLRASAIDATFNRAWGTQPFGSVAKVASNLVDPASFPAAAHIAPNHIESGTGRLLPYRTIAEDGVTSGKHVFRPGQVLYSKIRPYLKKAVVAEIGGLCSADMYPIDTELEPRFLKWWMLSERFTAEVIKQQGRSILPKINVHGLAALPVPVPDVYAQRLAADRVEHQTSLIDSLRVAIDLAHSRSAALRRSIFERAFHGELVPQDPDDEPASVLLERIRAERADRSYASGR